jgi:hypothetical protein
LAPRISVLLVIPSPKGCSAFSATMFASTHPSLIKARVKRAPVSAYLLSSFPCLLSNDLSYAVREHTWFLWILVRL